LCFFLAVGRGRRGIMDELRRSSGELVGMMGGSAGPSPLFLVFFVVFFFGGGVALALCKLYPGEGQRLRFRFDPC